MNRQPVRRAARRAATAATGAVLAAGLLAALALSGCHKKPLGKPWVRLDLSQEKPFVEQTPAGLTESQVYTQHTATLGAGEVRDMAQVPPDQQKQFPKASAGEIRVLEQMAGSRLKWRAHADEGSYVSFIPLGFDKPCPNCKFRMGLRDNGIIVKFEAVAQPLGPTAPKAVEIDLTPYAGDDVDILFQVDIPTPNPPGQPGPTVLWGSPALYSRQPQQSAFKPSRPNILLVGFDTLRADRLGPWGRRPTLSPTIDKLAAESDVWTQAYSTFNATNPSFASIMTGLYGKNHGVYDLHTRLPASFTTLAHRLADAGYQTMAVISARHLGDHNSGLGQGFAEVARADEHYAAELGVDHTIDWIGAHCTQPRPFFVWLHLFDAHTPHTPPEPYSDGLRPAAAAGLAPVVAWVPFRPLGPRRFDEPVLAGNSDLYDGEVAYLDHQLGRLLDAMDSRGLLDTTLVALVADHGENLGEHGIKYRHVGLYDTTTHVPLLVRWPGARQPGHRYDGLVQTIDLFPTLLAAARLPVPQQDGIELHRLSPAAAGSAGGSSAPAGGAAGAVGRRAVFAEHSNGFGAMVRTRDYKYIVSRGNTLVFPDGPSLYDLRADPQEMHNLAGQGNTAETEMAGLLDAWIAQRRNLAASPADLPQHQPLSSEDAARLRSLGYAGQ